MFRSVAGAYRNRAIALILTELLDDGAAGLSEIPQRGGLTVVEDPQEAAYPDMPKTALLGVAVDYTVGLAEMPALLEDLDCMGLGLLEGDG